jgi:hypothetical protein
MNDKINLSVDKRIELVCSVQTLASYWDDLSVKFFNKKLFDCPYRTGIFDYFNSYKHVILESYNALANNVLNFSAFFNLFLYYSDPPELSNRTKVPEGVLNCFPDKSALHEFTARLKDYAEISKFDVFFNDSGPLYKDLIRSFSGALNAGNSIDVIENYAGKYNKTYNIIIAPLCLGNYSFKIEDRLFIVFSPVNYGDGQYRFSPPFYNEMLLWHETCHSFVNDLTDNYKTLIEDLKIPDCFKNGV